MDITERLTWPQIRERYPVRVDRLHLEVEQAFIDHVLPVDLLRRILALVDSLHVQVDIGRPIDEPFLRPVELHAHICNGWVGLDALPVAKERMRLPRWRRLLE